MAGVLALKKAIILVLIALGALVKRLLGRRQKAEVAADVPPDPSGGGV